MVGTVKSIDFSGDVFVTEWGASYSGALARDTEISASFVAKTIHLIGTDNGIAPPSHFAGAGSATSLSLYELVAALSIASIIFRVKHAVVSCGR
jgi:hypothetical protein